MALDILRQRLHNQLLSQTKFDQPSQVVAWLGAVQSQDYAGAKWAIAQRAKGLTDLEIEESFSKGEILRTHVLRPTWHFVAPQDIRWMLALTGPRVLALLAFLDRQLEVDQALVKQTNTILAKALKGGKQCTRAELGSALQRNGMQTNGLRLGHIIMHAELDGIICSGPRRGKQFTYMLLDERAPQAKIVERDEALAELTKRYFMSHGPATLKDFVWWSGLTMADARKGIDVVKPQLEQEVAEGQTYWYALIRPVRKPSHSVFLLPNYDEYTVGYTDRSAIFDGSHADKLPRESTLAQSILIDGRVVGTWKRVIKKDEVILQFAPFTTLTEAEHEAVSGAAQQYGKFLGLRMSLTNVR